MSEQGETGPWPVKRSSRSSIAAQFGEDRADLMAWALRTGDPLADAVVEEMHDSVDIRVALNKGMSEGLAAIDDPSPGVTALLTSAETIPDHVDPAWIDDGPRPYFTMPFAVHLVSLSAGALVRVYASPSIGGVLAMSGRLIERAQQRIHETGRWLAQAMVPGTLRVGEAGYVATLQVRMLHAHMRRMARLKGYDQAANGLPINQVDLTRTWMDFTLTAMRAEEKMGFDLTVVEQAEMYEYWWYLGHLLGIDPRLIQGIKSNEEAARVDEMLQAVTPPPEPVSAQLVGLTLEAIRDDLHDALKIPKGEALHGLQVLARRFHGDAVADALEIPRRPVTEAIIDAAVDLNRGARQHDRRDKDKWIAARDKAIAEYPDEIKELPTETTFTKVAAAPLPGQTD